MWFVKVFRGDGDMECVRRAVAVEVENSPSELYAVEEQYRRIVEEVAVYVAERGRLEKEKYGELYRRFRKQYPLPAQLIQQAINQGVEIGKSFLEAKRNGRVHKPHPEVRRVSIRFAKDSWNYKKAISSAAPVRLGLSLPGGRREVWIKPHRRFWLYWWKVLCREAELASTPVLKRRRGRGMRYLYSTWRLRVSLRRRLSSSTQMRTGSQSPRWVSWQLWTELPAGIGST
jgi:putative transposase